MITSTLSVARFDDPSMSETQWGMEVVELADVGYEKCLLTRRS